MKRTELAENTEKLTKAVGELFGNLTTKEQRTVVGKVYVALTADIKGGA